MSLLAAAAAAITLAGCSAGDPRTQVAPAAQSGPLAEVAGPDCTGVPGTELAADPVLDAIGRIPTLSTLTTLLQGLPELTAALTDQQALTVYAPSDAAFDALRAELGTAAFDALLADPARLDGLLAYHVTGKRLDTAGLVEAGKTTQLAYGDVTVSGAPEAITLTSTAGSTARISCANIPTANATVFVVDHVLLPAPPTATR